jgi:hypothetical protein
VEEGLRGSPEAPLGERLQAAHIYRQASPEGGYQASVEVRFDWLFGSWVEGEKPWVWNAEVQYMGFVDLTALGKEMTQAEIATLEENIEGVRSRLRCLPGDQEARVFEGGSPCSYVATSQPDGFLQSGGAAVPALLKRILPGRFQARIGSLPRGGEPTTYPLRYVFSGSFPHYSADLQAPEVVQQSWGVPGRLRVLVR